MAKKKRGKSSTAKIAVLVFAVIVVVGFVAPSLMFLTSRGGGGGEAPRPAGVARFELRSIAFPEGGRIPVNYTCDGENVSPPLMWKGQPNGTVAYALIMEDPDAPGGVFTHWLIYNIPGWLDGLPPGVPRLGAIMWSSGVMFQGVNDFGRIGYDGPCPPPGKPHRYRFVLYALSEPLDLREAARREAFVAALQDRILGYAELTGVYGREG